MKTSKRIPPEVSGWAEGLSQDYNRGLANWFSSRPNARQEVRDLFLNRREMKYPKHRANIYLVQREIDGVVCGAFSTAEGADEFKGACEQDIVDKHLSSDTFKFFVSISTYYET